ncbi:hypothetical protein DFJ74DRAFT_709608 [Hyaloraphidium curvatum]|nr:hypothetical protein DFJ74DRAFT_709608 [Hyaloraphidium curvatum]
MSRGSAPLTFSSPPPSPAARWLLEALYRTHPRVWRLAAENDDLWLAVPNLNGGRGDASDSDDDDEPGRGHVPGSVPDEQWFLSHALRPLGWENPRSGAGSGPRERETPSGESVMRLVTLTEQPAVIRQSSLHFTSPGRKRKRRRIVGDAIAWDTEGRGVRLLWLNRPLVAVSDPEGGSAQPSRHASRSSTPLLATPSLSRSSTSTSLSGTVPGSASPSPTPRRPVRSRDWTPPLHSMLSRLRVAALSQPAAPDRRRPPSADQALERLTAMTSHLSSAALSSPGMSMERLQSNLRNTLNTIDELLVRTYGRAALDACQDLSAWPSDPQHLAEIWAQAEIYDVVFWRVSKDSASRDAAVERVRRGLEGLDLGSIGLLPPGTSSETERLLARNLRRGSRALRSVGSLRTPQEKSRCIARAVRALMRPVASAALTTDHLLPLLVLAVVRAGVPDLATNARYMELAAWAGEDAGEDEDDGEERFAAGELAFTMSTFEAVLSLLVSAGEDKGAEPDKEPDRTEPVAHVSSDGNQLSPVSAEGPDASPSTQLPPSPRSSLRSAFAGGISPMNEWLSKAERLRFVRQAVAAGDADGLSELLSAVPWLMKAKDEDGNTLLHLAVLAGREDNVKVLLGLGMDVGGTNYDQQTALHFAVEARGGSSDAILRSLLDAVLSLPRDEPIKVLNAASDDGSTVLHLVCASDQTSCVELLCDLVDSEGPLVDVNVQDLAGSTALHLATESYGPLLARSDLDLNLIDASGLTPVISHARAGNLAAVTALVADSRTDLGARDGGGRGLAHLAAYWAGHDDVAEGWIGVVQDLLSKGLDPNVQTIRGNGVLHAAADSGRVELISMLLEGGKANPMLLNIQGRVPADLARTQEIRTLLQSYAALVWDPVVEFRPAFPGGEERAVRVVATEWRKGKRDEEVVFVLVFGAVGDMKDCTYVRRSLDDFTSLRSNLLLEDPQALLPSLADLYSHPYSQQDPSPFEDLGSPTASGPVPQSVATAVAASPVVRRLERRVNRFLRHLFSNPSWRSNELLWEFCMDVPLNWTMVRERTQSKREMAIEDVVARYDGKYGTEGIRATELWIAEALKRASQLQTSLRAVGAAARRNARARREFAAALGQLKFFICRPAGVCFPWPAALLAFDALGAIADAEAKLGSEEALDAGEAVLDCLHDFADVVAVAQTHDDALRAYLGTQDKLRAAGDRFSKLELEARGEVDAHPSSAPPASGNRVMDRLMAAVAGTGTTRARALRVSAADSRLGDTKGTMKILEEQALSQAAFLEHVDTSIRASFDFQMVRHADELASILDGLVDRELEAAKEAVRSMESALASLKPIVSSLDEAWSAYLDESVPLVLALKASWMESPDSAAGGTTKLDGTAEPEEDPTVTPTSAMLSALQSAADDLEAFDVPTEPDRANLAPRKPVKEPGGSARRKLEALAGETEAEDRKRRALELLHGNGAPPLVLSLADDVPSDLDLILDVDMAEKLKSHFPSRFWTATSWKLLFSLAVHGTSLTTFFALVGSKGPTLWCIRTVSGKTIGAFVADDVVELTEAAHRFYGSGEGFLWEKLAGNGLRVCHSTLSNTYFITSTRSEIMFGAGGHAFIGLYLDSLGEGYSDGACPTFDMGGIALGRGVDPADAGPLDVAKRARFDFQIANVEIWGVAT